MSDPVIFKENKWKAQADKLFGQYDAACIVGKGVSFRQIKKPNNRTLLIGVNHAVNKIIKPDMVFCQDWPYWKELSPTVLQLLSFAVTPQNCINKGIWKSGIGPDRVAARIKKHFDGYVLPFSNLNSPDGSYKHVDHEEPKFWGSGYRALVFARAYLPNLKTVDSYGIAKGHGYHRIFQMNHTFRKYKCDLYLKEHQQICRDIFLDTDIEYNLH